MVEDIYSNEMIGKRLIQAREDKGFTQDDVASKLGVKRELISFWEHGKRELKAGYLIELSKLLNVSADYLLGLTEVQSVNPNMQASAAFLECNDNIVGGLKAEITYIQDVVGKDGESKELMVILEKVLSSDKAILAEIVTTILEMIRNKDSIKIYSHKALEDIESIRIYQELVESDKSYHEFMTYKAIYALCSEVADDIGTFYTKEEVKKIDEARNYEELLDVITNISSPTMRNSLTDFFKACNYEMISNYKMDFFRKLQEKAKHQLPDNLVELFSKDGDTDG